MALEVGLEAGAQVGGCAGDWVGDKLDALTGVSCGLDQILGLKDGLGPELAARLFFCAGRMWAGLGWD